MSAMTFVFLQRMPVRGKIAFGRWGPVFLTFAQSIKYRTAFAETPNHCRSITLGKSDWTYAGVEIINLSPTELRQTSHHSCACFKINKFDDFSSTKIRRLPQALIRGHTKVLRITGNISSFKKIFGTLALVTELSSQ